MSHDSQFTYRQIFEWVDLIIAGFVDGLFIIFDMHLKYDREYDGDDVRISSTHMYQ